MKWRRYRGAFTIGLLLLVYAAGQNPYFLPQTYDNIVYYFGARSLVQTGSFQYQGEPIGRWPPGFPALLALFFWVGPTSVGAAKLVVLGCVGAGLWLALGLFEREGRPFALTICALFALLPQGLLMGTRVMAEWPYIGASFLFLNLLDRLDRTDRRLGLALLAGTTLGAAALLRWVGVLLGAGVVLQACRHFRRDRHRPWFSRILPEVLVAAVGAALALAWIGTRTWAAETSAYQNAQDIQTLPVPMQFDVGGSLEKLAALISNVLFQASSAVRFLNLEDHPLHWVVALPALVVLVGLASWFGSGRGRPGDAYALATLAYIGTVYFKEDRYLLPIAPFLLQYFLQGGAFLAGVVRANPDSVRAWPRNLLLGTWMAGLVGLNGYLLAFGNVNGTHRGLSTFASPDAETFYRGYWVDLYRAGRRLQSCLEPGRVAVVGDPGAVKYVHAFSGRLTAFHGLGEDTRFVVVTAPATLADYDSAGRGAVELGTWETVTVYRMTEK